MKTYGCIKCGYVASINLDEELMKHVKEHSKDCNGQLEEAQGNCLSIAFKNLIDRPNLLFCYANVKGKIKGQSYLHAWNEGYDIKGDFFVIDDSNKNINVNIPRDSYYKMKKIKDKKVTRLNFEQVIESINDCLKKSERIINVWGWIN